MTRRSYADASLGPATLKLAGGATCARSDGWLKNERGERLEYSHWARAASASERAASGRHSGAAPAVVFCHGLGGNRCEAFPCATLLLPYGVEVFALDFGGSGRSEGSAASYGEREAADVAAAVARLRAADPDRRIGLWGRSMGAAACLFYGATDPLLAGMVLDSAFARLDEMLVEVGRARLPRCLGGCLLPLWTKLASVAIKAGTGVEPASVRPSDAAARCVVPGLLAHSVDDEVVPFEAAQSIFEQYGGEKNLLRLSGAHGDQRSALYFDSVAIFFYNVLTAGMADPSVAARRRRGRRRPRQLRTCSDSELLRADVAGALLAPSALTACSPARSPFRSPTAEHCAVQATPALRALKEDEVHKATPAPVWAVSPFAVPPASEEEEHQGLSKACIQSLQDMESSSLVAMRDEALVDNASYLSMVAAWTPALKLPLPLPSAMSPAAAQHYALDGACGLPGQVATTAARPHSI